MKKISAGGSRVWRMGFALFLLTTGSALADAAGKDADIKLTGTFNWTRKNTTENLDAVLTPTGTNAWTVVFKFNWDKKPYAWNGTIKGRLDNGDVSGEACSDGGKRTFTFQGTASNHVISLQHVETTGKKNVPTGNCTLNPVAPKP